MLPVFESDWVNILLLLNYKISSNLSPYKMNYCKYFDINKK